MGFGNQLTPLAVPFNCTLSLVVKVDFNGNSNGLPISEFAGEGIRTGGWSFPVAPILAPVVSYFYLQPSRRLDPKGFQSRVYRYPISPPDSIFRTRRFPLSRVLFSSLANAFSLPLLSRKPELRSRCVILYAVLDDRLKCSLRFYQVMYISF